MTLTNIDHTALAAFLITAMGVVTGYIAPLLGLVLTILGITYYVLQIRRMRREDRKHD